VQHGGHGAAWADGGRCATWAGGGQHRRAATDMARRCNPSMFRLGEVHAMETVQAALGDIAAPYMVASRSTETRRKHRLLGSPRHLSNHSTQLDQARPIQLTLGKVKHDSEARLPPSPKAL